MLLVFNKTDVSRHDFALDWMADFETFHVALQADSSYASTLSKSLSLVRPYTAFVLPEQNLYLTSKLWLANAHRRDSKASCLPLLVPQTDVSCQSPSWPCMLAGFGGVLLQSEDSWGVSSDRGEH